MKRLFAILLVLCPYVSYGTLLVQIHTTSSATYRSHTTSGGLESLPILDFRTTNSYGRSMATTRTYSTAPMNVANGVVRTAASSMSGGVLLGGVDTNSGGTTIIPVIPGVPDTPIGEGWDVAILLGICCAAYALFIAHKRRQANT